MKKRYFLQAILAGCILLAGCGGTENESVAAVEEIPIEASAESAQNAVEEAVSKEQTDAMQQVEIWEDVSVEVNGDKGTILVGTVGAPYTELLTQAKLHLAKDGWDMQIKYYEDYEKLNEDVLNSVLDAHLFAHRTYIDSYNDVNKTELVGVLPVCYEVYGIYSKLNDDLMSVGDAVIGLPQEDEKKARALLLLHDLGWITLKENRGMPTTMEDVETNNRNLQFAEYTQETLMSTMDESDYCIIGADTAIVGGLDAEEDVIRAETAGNTGADVYAALLVTTQEKSGDEKIQVLADALVSDEMAEYVYDTYKGALQLMR